MFGLRLRPDLDDSCYRDLDGYLAKGKGLAVLHAGLAQLQADSPVNAKFAARIGLSWRDGVAAFREGEFTLEISPEMNASPAHPLAAGFPASIRLTDECYFNLVGDASKIKVLAKVNENGSDWPMMWSKQIGGGRVFVTVPGYFNWTHDDPFHRIRYHRNGRPAGSPSALASGCRGACGVPGSLAIYDLRGEMATTAKYDGAMWLSDPPDLRAALYLYVFRGGGGKIRSCRMVPSH